ncbi:MAG: Rieske 2Fe-2S domain-containing protein [Nitrospirota bacterium]
MVSAAAPHPRVPDETFITTLGHAGLWCQLGGITLLCDPWLSDTGAFLASWHVFPPNDHLDRAPLLAPDYIYISHIHEDHFDRAFLARVNKRATVIIPNFPDKRLCNQLRALGFPRVVELDDSEVFSLGSNAEVQMLIQAIPDWHDSALLITTAAGSILNQNDCKLNDKQVDCILRAHGSPSLYYAQFSPANWYPIAYGYPPEKEQRIKRLERDNQLTLFLRHVTHLCPRLVVPFAGPPAFLDPDTLEHSLGANSMFPMMSEAVALVEERRATGQIETRAAALLPGDTVHLPELGIEPDPHWLNFDFAKKDVYLRDYASRRAPTIAAYRASFPAARPGLFAQFSQYINRLAGAHPYLMSRINMAVLFQIEGPHGGSWLADFRRARDMVVKVEGGQYPYSFWIAGCYLQSVLDGDISFDSLFLSLRFRARRDPDLYNQDLMTLLKRDDTAALRAVEAHRRQENKKEHIELEAVGAVYRVEKFCPHAGGNLEHARIENGVLTCPFHGWKFRVADGKCLTAQCRDLDITEIYRR